MSLITIAIVFRETFLLFADAVRGSRIVYGGPQSSVFLCKHDGWNVFVQILEVATMNGKQQQEGHQYFFVGEGMARSFLSERTRSAVFFFRKDLISA